MEGETGFSQSRVGHSHRRPVTAATGVKSCFGVGQAINHNFQTRRYSSQDASLILWPLTSGTVNDQVVSVQSSLDPRTYQAIKLWPASGES